MLKHWHKPTVVLVFGAAVGAHQLAQYIVASYQGEHQSSSLTDMTTTAASSDTGSFHSGGIVFAPAGIIEPQKTKPVSHLGYFIAMDPVDECDTGHT